MEWQLSFLRALAEIRNPILDAFFGAVTYLGSETGLIVVALVFFWCFDKKQAYYLFSVGLFGTVVNQCLKISFRVPRPWVIDPTFEPIASAVPEATGYSFPSGHTQSAVGLFGCMFRIFRKTWARVLCALPILLVPLSRMYLGVHTPMDVGVSFLIALLLVIVFSPILDWAWGSRRRMGILLGSLTGVALAYLLFVLVFPFPADVDAENLASALKNGYTLTGTLAGLTLVYFLDEYVIHIETRASLPAQLIKLAGGGAIAFLIKSLLKPPLTALFGVGVESLPRYFLLVLFAGAVWPLTFPYINRCLPRKSGEKAKEEIAENAEKQSKEE